MSARLEFQKDANSASPGFSLQFTLVASAFLMFGLQILLAKVLEFYHSGSQMMQILPFVFLGLSFGALLSLIFPAQKVLPLATKSIGFWLLLFAIALSQTVDWRLLVFCSSFVFATLSSIHTAAFRMIKVRRVYLLDLLGAALGIMITFYLLPKLGGEVLFFAFCALSFFVSLINSLKSKSLILLYLTLMGLVCSGAVLQIENDWFNLMRLNNDTRQFDTGQRMLKSGRAKLLHTKWSNTSRVDVLEHQDQSRWLYFNNLLFSRVNSIDTATPNPECKSLFCTFPAFEKALVIGPGGGREIKTLVQAGAKQITAVEINSSVIELMRGPLKTYSHDLYDYASIQHLDGRSFLANTDERFNVINLYYAALNYPTGLSNVFAENYLYTKEGIRDYFSHLKANGMLAIGKHYSVQVGPQMLRIASAVIEVMKEKGWSPQSQIVFLKQISTSDTNTGILLAKNSPFSKAELDGIEHLAQNNKIWHVVYSPQTTSQERDYFDNIFMNLMHATNQDDLQSIYQAQYIDFRPTTDDKPFFYSVEKKINFFNFINPYFLVIATLALLGFLIFIPGRRLQHPMPQVHKFLKRSFWLSGVSGVCYGLSEIIFIQHYNLSLGLPTLTYAAVVLALLSGGGLAILIPDMVNINDLKIRLVAFVVLITLLGIHYVLPSFLQTLNLGLEVKALFLFVSLLPLTCFLCWPYVHMLKVTQGMNIHTPIGMFAMNSLASVLGMCFAMILSFWLGFKIIYLLTAAIYCLMLTMGFRNLKSIDRRQPKLA